jgi:hypothetical protein
MMKRDSRSRRNSLSNCILKPVESRNLFSEGTPDIEVLLGQTTSKDSVSAVNEFDVRKVTLPTPGDLQARLWNLSEDADLYLRNGLESDSIALSTNSGTTEESLSADLQVNGDHSMQFLHHTLALS